MSTRPRPAGGGARAGSAPLLAWRLPGMATPDVGEPFPDADPPATGSSRHVGQITLSLTGPVSLGHRSSAPTSPRAPAMNRASE